MKVVSNEEFGRLWDQGSILACPYLRSIWLGDEFYWLSPKGKDVCKKCVVRFCHNHGRDFDEQDRLIVPETPMPELLDEQFKRWLSEWDPKDEAVRLIYADVERVFRKMRWIKRDFLGEREGR